MSDLTDVHAALRKKMADDGTLTGLLGSGTRVFHHPPRRPKTVPSIVFWDVGNRPDTTVPLHDRMVTITAWHTSYEAAEKIGKRVRALFDKQPLAISGGGWRFMGMYWRADTDEPLEDGDNVNRSQQFQLLAYEVG